jgi:hypothetical protein
VRVASYSPNTTLNSFNGNDKAYLPGFGDTLVLKDFLEKDAFQGVKYYVYKDLYVTDDDLITIDPNKALYVEILPNDSWAFEVVRVTVYIEMKVA